jgi:hypothetical protein
VPFGYQLTDNGARSRAGNPVALAAVPAQLAVVERVRRERASGRSMRAIAAGLTADGVPTATGAATWGYSSVQRLVQRFSDVAEATADVLHGMTQPAATTTLSDAVA